MSALESDGARAGRVGGARLGAELRLEALSATLSVMQERVLGKGVSAIPARGERKTTERLGGAGTLERAQGIGSVPGRIATALEGRAGVEHRRVQHTCL